MCSYQKNYYMKCHFKKWGIHHCISDPNRALWCVSNLAVDLVLSHVLCCIMIDRFPFLEWNKMVSYIVLQLSLYVWLLNVLKRVQIAEDLSSAHCRHCPHGYWRIRPGVWSGSWCSLLLVKNEGAIWRERRSGNLNGIKKERGAHFRKERKRKIKTLFLKWDFFSK